MSEPKMYGEDLPVLYGDIARLEKQVQELKARRKRLEKDNKVLAEYVSDMVREVRTLRIENERLRDREKNDAD